MEVGSQAIEIGGISAEILPWQYAVIVNTY